MDIDLYGVTVQTCQTSYGEYTIEFYPSDYKRSKVKKAIPDRYKISHKENAEGGELVIWFIKEK